LWEMAMELTLGRFGDERLEKGGAIWLSGLSDMAVGASACGSLAGGAPERCGSRGFCTIGA
jgi:hypothetical protein